MSTSIDGTAHAALVAQLTRHIRDVPDFPSPGILFKDITPLMKHPRLFADVQTAMADPFVGAGITHVAAIESRGFLFGPAIAFALNARFVPIRKPNKLPWRTRRVEYALEYGTDALEIHEDACDVGARVLLVDDILATGGTASAARQLVEMLSGTVVGATFLGEIHALQGRDRLQGITVSSLLGF
jgi:adenine phosphoribosyltransferase